MIELIATIAEYTAWVLLIFMLIAIYARLSVLYEHERDLDE